MRTAILFVAIVFAGCGPSGTILTEEQFGKIESQLQKGEEVAKSYEASLANREKILKYFVAGEKLAFDYILAAEKVDDEWKEYDKLQEQHLLLSWKEDREGTKSASANREEAINKQHDKLIASINHRNDIRDKIFDHSANKKSVLNFSTE